MEVVLGGHMGSEGVHRGPRMMNARVLLRFNEMNCPKHLIHIVTGESCPKVFKLLLVSDHNANVVHGIATLIHRVDLDSEVWGLAFCLRDLPDKDAGHISVKPFELPSVFEQVSQLAFHSNSPANLTLPLDKHCRLRQGATSWNYCASGDTRYRSTKSYRS